MMLDDNENISYLLNKDIVWIRQSFDHHSAQGGYDRLCCALKKRIASDTHSIWYRESKNSLKKISQKRVVNRIGRPRKNFFRHRGTLPELKALLYKPLRRKIIHVMYGEMIMGLLRFKPLKGKSKLVLTVHQPCEWWRDHDIPLNYFNRIDAIIVLSLNEIDFFNEKTEGRAFYVPHGIDTEFFLGVSSEQIRFKNERREFSCLTVGQWERDFRTLEHVVTLLTERDENIFFDIVISRHIIAVHSHAVNLSRLLKHRKVRWHHEISDDKLAKLYQSSNILLLPVQRAVANNAILEASASGLPIVATHLSGIRNYTTDEFAILTPLGDAAAMAAAVMFLKNTPQKNFFRSKMARINARDKYSWDIVSEKIMAIYQNL